MSTRTIKLKLLTQMNLVSIETSVRTLGEFKALPEVVALNLNWDQIKLIDRATQNSIELNSSVLPAIDAIIFVTATKTASGAMSQERKNLYKSMKALQGMGIHYPGFYSNAKTSDLAEFIANNTPGVSKKMDASVVTKAIEPSATTSTVDTSKVSVAKVVIKDLIAKLQAMIGPLAPSIDVAEIAEVVKKDELEEEAKAIAAAFKNKR